MPHDEARDYPRENAARYANPGPRRLLKRPQRDEVGLAQKPRISRSACRWRVRSAGTPAWTAARAMANRARLYPSARPQTS